MARNYVQPGDTITVSAPATVASGAGALVGVTFGVALHDAASGDPLEMKRTGIWTLPKATGETWTAFTTKLYWDNSAKKLTATSSGNTLVGVAATTQASGDTSGRALLTGQIA